MSALRHSLPIIAILILGYWLRIHDLEAVPLRGDEAFSARYWSDIPLSQSLPEIAPLDPHPPLSFVAFRLWGLLVGGIDSVFSLRYLSALGNTLGITAIYALSRLVMGRRGAALLAALMWALHPYEIWHSQDYRNYALWAGVSVTALWLGLRLLRRRKALDWLLYLMAAFASAMLFYTEVFNILALAFVFILLAGWRRFVRRLLGLQAAILLAALLSFAVLQARAGFLGAYGGNLEGFAALDYLRRFLPLLTIGEIAGERLPGLWLLLALVYGLAALLVFKRSRRQFLTLLPLICLPLLLLGAASLFKDIFNPRYALHVVPALIMLLVAGAFHAAQILQKAIAAGQAVLALCLLSPWFALAGLRLHSYYTDESTRKSPAWDELGGFLTGRVNESDLVIQLSVDPAFGYYYRGSAADMALPVDAAQPVEEIEAALEELRGRYDSLYVVAREQAGWKNAGAVEAWMDANLQETLRADAGGLPIRQYMEWTIEEEVEREIARFGETVALMSYELFRQPQPTGDLLLWLYWKPLAMTERALKSFVHVSGEVNPATGTALWSQDDQFPQAGRLDSRGWSGDVFRAVHYLPTAGLAAGDYQILVGWYEPVSGARLALPDDADSFVLQSWSVAASGGLASQ